MATDSINPGNGALVPAGEDHQIQIGDDKSNDALSSAGKYLPRVQLMVSGSTLVTDAKIGIGRYALIKTKESFDDLTSSFDGLVLARRPKALRIDKDGIMSIYDTKDPEFEKIELTSEVKNSGCSFGPEYLIWVKPARAFATFFCNSKTSRRSSADLNTILKNWKETKKEPFVTFKASQKQSPQFKWWGPDFVPCSTPFAEVPSWADVKEQTTKFLNPPKNQKETVDQAASGDRSR